MRIYDAKQGSQQRLTARLDWAVSLSWYVALIITSPHYLHDLLRAAYLSGVPILSADAVTLLRSGAIVFSSGLSVVYLAYHFNLWRRGLPVSWRKLVMLTIFLSATFYLYVFLNDFLVGFSVWSAFHCVQYYGIVWVYNRSRVDRKSRLTAAVRFLFRPSFALLLLYLGLTAAYGSINYWTGFVASESLQRLMLAFVLTSNILHYYYDGFIWKVREPETQRHLAIDAGDSSQAAAVKTRPRLNSGIVQAVAGSAAVFVLLVLELSRPVDDLETNRSLVAAAPKVGGAHFRLAIAELDRGLTKEALVSYESALELLPNSWRVRNDLAILLAVDGQSARAERLLREATALLEDEPDRTNMASWSALSASLQAGDREVRGRGGSPSDVYANLADLLADRGDHAASLKSLDRALQRDPDSVRALTNRGAALGQQGRVEEAVKHFERALEIDPDYSYAHFNLGSLRAGLGNFDLARFHFQRAAQTGDPAQRQAALNALRQLEASLRR
ncbi:MAG: tetratricopeptide repeat protein [Acidobacteriota bacterium]